MNQNLTLNKQKLRDKKHNGAPFISYALSLFLICSFIAVVAGCAGTKSKDKEAMQIQEPAVITGISVQDNMVTITANKPFIYTMYKPGDPYKIVLDMPDVSLGAFNAKIVSQKPGITEIMPSQIESPSLLARFEMLLQTPGSIDQDYNNNVLTIKIRQDAVKREEPLPVVQVKKMEEPATMPAMRGPLPKATEINEISFEPSVEGVKVLIKGNGSMLPNVFPLEDRLVIDIPDVTLNALIPLSVVSPVKGMRAGKHDEKVRLVLDLKEKTNFDVASIGDSIVISLKRDENEPAGLASLETVSEETSPASTDAIQRHEKLTGTKCGSYLAGKETVNFDFQDQDIVPILRLFADISGCNLFIHPDVKGKATMKFRDVPWDQALDTILKTFSLDKDIQGNIIRIAPNTVFARESDEKTKVQEAGMRAEPLETRVFSVSYAEVGLVETAVRNAKILSPRGSLNLDKRTSTMLVKDIASVFPEIENLLATLDKPTPQVLVEARIVEVNTDNTQELGIQWGINAVSANGLAALGGLSGVPNVLTGPVTGGHYMVDLPSKSAGPLSGSGITFGVLDPSRTIGLDMQLSAIETLGKLKVVSNPKILTVDNGKAMIKQGKSIPVRKLTTEGTVSTEYKDVTLDLIVTPHITPDKSISMVIEIKKEELDPTVPSVEGVPGTDKKEASTNVIIKDGETIVIGGLYKIATNDAETGVPGLMNIPVLGWLFKSKREQTSTNELLIFVTPRIITSQ
ncbi:MAG: type IV pilus secretin PilQ [Thermodesulfovibrionales bacterium]|nr:type IV pilus secretin PilQ [Thermodesulfovibrionales bacterium]